MIINCHRQSVCKGSIYFLINCNICFFLFESLTGIAPRYRCFLVEIELFLCRIAEMDLVFHVFLSGDQCRFREFFVIA